MTGLRDAAPAKINLCLFVGPARADGRHELVTVFQPIALADEVELEPAGLGARDDGRLPRRRGREPRRPWRCGGSASATGWDGAPVRLTIDKRIPVAAGMAGGSADAAAALRLVARVAGIDDDGLLREIAAELGADVAAQVRPGRYLATGAGERLTAAARRRRPTACS